MRFDQIPKPLMVCGVLAIGVLAIFFISEPHTTCHTQLEAFQKAQEGNLFPKKVKKQTSPALYPRAKEACLFGNSAGACYEYFASIRSFLRNLQLIPDNCGELTFQVVEIKRAISESLEILVQSAWGSSPPNDRVRRLGWLEAPDLALFCSLRDEWVRLRGKDSWDEFRIKTSNNLPGEASVYQNGVCTNCEKKALAKDTITSDEIWKWSIFSVNCNQYR